MAKHQWKGRRLRLRSELAVIGGAVEAARILGEALATQQLGLERDHRRAPRAITSLLTMVEQQLRQVRRRRWRPVEAQRSAAPRYENTEVRRGGAAQLRPDERILALVAMRQRATARRRAPML